MIFMREITEHAKKQPAEGFICLLPDCFLGISVPLPSVILNRWLNYVLLEFSAPTETVLGFKELFVQSLLNGNTETFEAGKKFKLTFYLLFITFINVKSKGPCKSRKSHEYSETSGTISEVAQYCSMICFHLKLDILLIIHH